LAANDLQFFLKNSLKVRDCDIRRFRQKANEDCIGSQPDNVCLRIVGWHFAKSTSLLADAFDMLADASSYLVALLAIGRSTEFKINAARWNGTMLIVLGLGVVGEAIHRFFAGSEPLGLFIIGFATLSLFVNGAVLIMLSRYRNTDEMHLKATWRDTRADVLVNVGVLASGAAIVITGYGIIDPIVGLAIGMYVIKEGFEIWTEADD
jgi:cation diffusion facilitator family transporter